MAKRELSGRAAGAAGCEPRDWAGEDVAKRREKAAVNASTSRCRRRGMEMETVPGMV